MKIQNMQNAVFRRRCACPRYFEAGTELGRLLRQVWMVDLCGSLKTDLSDCVDKDVIPLSCIGMLPVPATLGPFQCQPATTRVVGSGCQN